MPGFGLGFGHARQRGGKGGIVIPEPSAIYQFGALSRSSFGAGITLNAAQIVAGDAGGHWTISNGRLFPSAAGDAADLNAGPYVLLLDNGDAIRINVEPRTWDVADQSEWDVVATQDAATLAGSTIALRHEGELTLGINGTINTPFRNSTYEDANGNPCTVKGRFGEVGSWADYCLIDKVASMRGAQGVRFEHLRTTPVAETKVRIISQNSGGNISRDITIHDCWITGEVGDPNGDYSTSTNYPNHGVDLITTGGKTAPQGNVTITDCLIEWAGECTTVSVGGAESSFTFTGNECRYFYGDAVQHVNSPTEQAGAFICRDNFIHSCVGRGDDSGNSHADSIRIQGTTNALGDIPITIEDNVILPGNSRGDAQGIFLDDMKSGGVDSGHFFVATIRNNIVQVVDTGHGITIGQPKNCLVEENTVLGNNDDSNQIVFIGTAGGSQGTDGGGNVIQNNIVETLQLTAGDAIGNFELGLNGASIPYSTALVGPSWAPTTPEQAKALFQAKVAAGAVFGSRANAAPAILSPSIEGEAQDGEILTVSAQATGFPQPAISYQWQINGNDIVGETSASLSLNVASLGIVNGDLISCEVVASNSQGSTNAEPAIGYFVESDDYLVQGATAGYFFDPANVPANSTRITFRGKLYWPQGTFSNGQRPFNINSTGCDLALLGNGTFQVTVEDSSFQKKLLAHTVPGVTLEEDTWYTIVFDVDQIAETATVTVNGIVQSIAFTASSSGTFQTGQKIGLLGASSGAFTVKPGVRAADLSVEINGSPHKTISNSPNEANADPWHAGSDLMGS